MLAGSIASGSYTAFSLASFKPSETLKGAFGKSGKGIWLRKSLVVFQFSISVVLIASTFILYRQLRYMQNKDLGVSLSQLVVMSEPEIRSDTTFRQRTRTFMNALSQQSFVSDYCMSGSVPGVWYNYSGADVTRTNPNPGDEKTNYFFMFIDDRYLPLYHIPLVAGRNYTSEICSKKWNQVDQVMVNEQAMKLLGFESALQAVGQKIIYGKREYEVRGVIKDYHHLSLRQAIDPVIFFPMYNVDFFTARISTEHVQSNMQELEKLYKKSFPGNPFAFFFADEKYNQQYQTEQSYGIIFSLASGLAVFIACLGLFGLATFTVEQRVKEIGIRKVLGASVAQIARLISGDFLLLVVVAIFIAMPFAWYASNQWLQEFAYRTQISWWIFFLAGFAAILIALLTVSSQALKASLSNPVDSLRNE